MSRVAGPTGSDRIALVAGATRGAGRGIAVELGALGATVYVTGRSTRTQRSEIDRPETLEETAELVTVAGGVGIAVPTDHLVPEQVATLTARIEREHGHLDVLVNDIWGAEHLVAWSDAAWDHPLEAGLRMLRLAVETHLITLHHALPLLLRRPGGLVVEMTDGTHAYNAERYRRPLYYDLAKTTVLRLAWGLAQELAPQGATAVALTPGWLRSEQMLQHFGVTEATWRAAVSGEPHFAISESPRYVGRAVAHLATDPAVKELNGRSLSSGELAHRYAFDDVDGSRPDCFRYLLEVVEAGKPADVTGYR